MKKLEVVIFDLDGCLIDFRARLNFYNALDESNRPPETSLLKYDKPIRAYVELWRSVCLKEIKPIVVTARKENLSSATISWLHLNNLEPFEIFFKPSISTESDPEFKKRIVCEKILGKYDVLFAIDDDPAVCEAYRKLNLEVLHIRR